MTDLPQVGQKYQHKKWGEVEVFNVAKRGRGYTICVIHGTDREDVSQMRFARLKDFQKATT